MNLFTRFSTLVFAALLLAGCATPDTGKQITQEDITPAPLFITQGDVLDISFPGASNLSGQHKVGPDGTITLPLVGQVVANGKTTEQLRQELLKLYDKELQDKQVLVSLNSTANLVYVIGAVLRPGRIPMDRPMTALEAIMEAGGFVPTQANLKKVTVVRYDGDHNYTYHLNLSPALEGGPVAPFYLKPRDIVNVPIKVEWF
jgi:protein involved in polysaccharide export with SLBB domain